MKRFPEFARRAAALALAASMSLSVLAPGAYAVSAPPHDHTHSAAENSVDELGNEDLSDETGDAVTLTDPEEPETPAEEDETHQWGEWTEGTYQEGEDGEIQNVKIRICSDCGVLQLEDGTVLTPSTDKTLEIVDPDEPEQMTPGANLDGNYDDQIAPYDSIGVHDGGHEFDYTGATNVKVWYSRPTCTQTGSALVRCIKWWHVRVYVPFVGWQESSGQCDYSETHTINMAPHSYGNWIEQTASCTAAGKKYRVCSVCGHEDVDTDYATKNPQLPHSWSDWVETEATCTTAGSRTRTCATCGKVEPDETYAAEHPATDHNWDVEHAVIEQEFPCVDGTITYTCLNKNCPDKTKTDIYKATEAHKLTDWIVTKEPTCTENGERVKKCTVCGQTIETETIEKLGHDYQNYTDDNKPACCDQYETGTCTRCGAKDTRKTSGPIRAHKYTRYVLSNINGDMATRAHCDYEGCDAVDRIPVATDRLKDTGYAMAATEAAETLADYMDGVIRQAMRDAEAAVGSASTREEAIASLDTIVASVHSQLLAKKVEGTYEIDPGLGAWSKIKIPYSVSVTEDMIGGVMNDLQNGMDTVKQMINNSFLSMDAIKTLIGKVADTVEKSDDINYSMRQIVFPEVYYQIAKKYPAGDNSKEGEKATITNLILQLASDLVKVDPNAETDAVQEFVGAIFDDLVDMLIEELKKDEDYSKYLDNKLGDQLLEELRPKLREELVNDSTFMDTIRTIAQNAIDNAAKGVNKGWTDEAINKQLREDLLKVQDPVEEEMNYLATRIGDLVSDSLAQKINKYLPFGDLTSWIGRWIGNFAKDKVIEEVTGETGKVRSTIDLYINYITCGNHNEETRVSAATCTGAEVTEKYCTKCKWVFSKKETAPALGHTPVNVAGYAATETTDGLTDGIQCAVCGTWIEPQEVIPALTPEYDKWYVKANVTADTVKATGYKNQQKLDETIDAALQKAGFDPANSERFLAQVQTNLDVLKDELDREPGEGASRILPNDRYPEDGVTGMVRFPAKAPGKDGTYYAVQILTADSHGYSAGDVVVTPLTVTEEGISFKTGVQAVVAIAWKPNN